MAQLEKIGLPLVLTRTEIDKTTRKIFFSLTEIFLAPVYKLTKQKYFMYPKLFHPQNIYSSRLKYKITYERKEIFCYLSYVLFTNGETWWCKYGMRPSLILLEVRLALVRTKNPRIDTKCLQTLGFYFASTQLPPPSSSEYLTKLCVKTTWGQFTLWNNDEVFK